MELSPTIPRRCTVVVEQLEDVVCESIDEDSIQQIAKHKWIESERAGHDLGEQAVQQWISDHWHVYLRARWLEHLQGVRYWSELDNGDFKLLQRAFHAEQEMLDTIIDKLKRGDENLDIIHWAISENVNIDPILRILEAVDINSRRLIHRFKKQ